MKETLDMRNFTELSSDEMVNVDGGRGQVVGGIIGMVVSFIVDGICIATTGKSASEWIAQGIVDAVTSPSVPQPNK